jgi:hypothetical protein
MVMNSHQGSTFQSPQSQHPNELQVLMKWLELLHEGEMVLQNEIPKIDELSIHFVLPKKTKYEWYPILLWGQKSPHNQ